MTTTLDLKRELKHIYQPSAKHPAIVQVPPMRFLAVDGAGAPGGERFKDAMQALFALAYPVRFGAKKRLDLDYPVMAPEGVYWAAGGGPLDADTTPEQMVWTLRITIPDQVPESFVEEMRAEVAAKGKGGPLLGEVRVRSEGGGPGVTMMHVGPYAAETPTILRMTAFAAEQGYAITGRHHEIYIGDPNRSAPEKLKTTLRLGITKRG